MPTLLCIDDETYAQATRVAWLRAHGYHVILARSMETAIDCVVGNPVDAVLLDCHTDPLGKTTNLLRQVSEDLPIIVLASYCAVPCPHKDAVTVCLAKREQPVALLQALKALMTNGPNDRISPSAA